MDCKRFGGEGIPMSDTFNDKLNPPRKWCEDLLEELADTHHVGFQCDMRGGFRSGVNTERKKFLENVLGLQNVSYRVCEYCHTFALTENTDSWPFPSTCDNCTDRLPPALRGNNE